MGEGGGKVRPAVTRVGPSAARDGKKLDNPDIGYEWYGIFFKGDRSCAQTCRKWNNVILFRKRYDRAEKEFLEAKMLFFTKLERKELLTHHLCTIIEQNEMRKAQKLSELMEKLDLRAEMVSGTVFVYGRGS